MTIRQLAEVLGLSKSTIGTPCAEIGKQETQEFVQRRLANLVYPNPIARIPATGPFPRFSTHQANLALLCPEGGEWIVEK